MLSAKQHEMKLCVLGDISFADFPFCAGYGIRSALSRGLDPFIHVRHVLSNADLVIGNLESVLSDVNLDRTDLLSWEMRGDPVGARLLKETNVGVVNVANNHIMQHGVEAFDDMISLLKRNNIQVAGLIGQDGSSCEPTIVAVQGKRIGILGYGFEEDTYGHPLRYAYGPKCNIEKDISGIRGSVDVIVVSCHWGLEFMSYPSPHTVMQARGLVNCGADIVVGHHSHVVQGCEKYKNSLIAYSMGNFLFDMLWDESFRNGMILEVILNKGEMAFESIPTDISEEYCITLRSGSDARKWQSEFEIMCSSLPEIVGLDIERHNCKYYMEYEKRRKRNRYQSYAFFLKNILKKGSMFRRQILLRTVRRKINS